MNILAGKDAVSFWLENAGRYPVLPVETVLHLSKDIQTLEDDDPRRKKAIDKLIRHNLKLVPQQVRRVMRNRKSSLMPGAMQEDLLQAGVLGLQKAVLGYDYSRGYAFSTYAVNWIYQQIQRTSYASMSLIRVPENTVNELYKASDPVNNVDMALLPKHTQSRYNDAKIALGVRSADVAYSNTSDRHNGSSQEVKEVNQGTSFDKPLSDSVSEILALCPNLTETEIDIVLSRCIEGQTHAQLAEKHGVSKHQVAKTIKSTLGRLKAAMNQIN